MTSMYFGLVRRRSAGNEQGIWLVFSEEKQIPGGEPDSEIAPLAKARESLCKIAIDLRSDFKKAIKVLTGHGAALKVHRCLMD
jgi:hypothetical protein